MINFHDHGDALTVCGQVTLAQLRELAAAGLRSVVCHRPDDEDGAVPAADMARIAAEVGITFAHQPVAFSSIGPTDAERFAALLDSLPKPMLAYCRTGRRSAALWVMARVPRLGIECALNASAASGCELGELRPRLHAAAANGPKLAVAHHLPGSQA